VQTHWVTGVSAPCTGTFKPVWIDSGLPDLGPSPKGDFGPDSLWWRHEQLHRAVLGDYKTRLACYQPERDALEADFLHRETEMRVKSAVERGAFSAECFSRSADATARWTQQVRNAPIQNHAPALYRFAWAWFNKQARFR
jgi:dipeptidase